MSDTKHVELTKPQRDVLLQGLRYVRSSIMLEMRDPTPEDSATRTTQLREIALLVDQLNGSAPAPTTADV